jgi:hypothetical protein
MFIRKLCLCISVLLLISCSRPEQTSNTPIVLDLDQVPHYNDVDYWLQKDQSAHALLMSSNVQAKHYQRFLEQWYAPWHADTVLQALNEENIYEQVAADIKQFQREIETSVALKINFRAYTPAWLSPISENIHVAQFEKLNYRSTNRAIVTQNSMVRVLPTHDVYYRRFIKTGNVLPFDRLQSSVIWLGTPVYILGTTQDKAWHYIYTSSYTGWLPAESVSAVNQAFIDHWQSKPLMAIMRNQVSLIDDQDAHYLGQVGIGAVFPGQINQDQHSITIQFPVRNTNGQAQLNLSTIKNDLRSNILPMPVTPDRAHFALVLKEMVDQPYGWGGMNFYNDCSQELKNIYTPFGIWLQRHSSLQVQGLKIDNLDDVKNEDARIDFTRKHAHPFMTIAYIGGHIMMYVGEDENDIPVFYQNIWMVREKNTSQTQIIGQSLFLPLNIADENLHSLADPNIRDHFWLGYIDELVEN